MAKRTVSLEGLPRITPTEEMKKLADKISDARTRQETAKAEDDEARAQLLVLVEAAKTAAGIAGAVVVEGCGNLSYQTRAGWDPTRLSELDLCNAIGELPPNKIKELGVEVSLTPASAPLLVSLLTELASWRNRVAAGLSYKVVLKADTPVLKASKLAACVSTTPPTQVWSRDC